MGLVGKEGLEPLEKGWEKGGWEAEILRLREPLKIEKRFGRKGIGCESQRYLKWEVHTPCPFPPYNLFWVTPD